MYSKLLAPLALITERIDIVVFVTHMGERLTFTLIPVGTLELRQSVRQVREKYNSEWVKRIKSRFYFEMDLPAADVFYHQQYSVNFRAEKLMPLPFASTQDGEPTIDTGTKKHLVGRRKNDIRRKSFLFSS